MIAMTTVALMFMMMRVIVAVISHAKGKDSEFGFKSCTDRSIRKNRATG